LTKLAALKDRKFETREEFSAELTKLLAKDETLHMAFYRDVVRAALGDDIPYEIEFPEDIRETKIKVAFSVDRAYANRIREGTQAQLKSLSYVSQERYIELTPGDPERPQLSPGSRIEPGVSGFAELTERRHLGSL
jgi:hypothetical protein